MPSIAIAVRILTCCLCALGGARLVAADTPPYPPSYRVPATDPSALVSSVDWLGPDNVVYPDFSRVGVGNGAGIPDTSSWGVVTVSDGYAGAAVDGDLTAELRRAIDDAGRLWHEQGLPGCVVELPVGDWVLSGPLAIEDDGILIRGHGRTRTRIALDAPITRSNRNRPIGEVDAPIVDVDPYLGKVHRFSSLVVMVDPRYEYKDSRWDDPGAPEWRQAFPRNTVEEVRLYLYDPDTGERVQDDGADVMLRSNDLANANKGEMVKAWRADKFYSWKEHLQTTAMLQPEVEYEDGTVLTGAVTSFPAAWDASPDFKRSANSKVAWFVFAGDEWSHRGDEVPLTRPAQRGDTVLHLLEDVRTRTEPDFGAIGDLLRVQIYGSKDRPYKAGSGATRRQIVRIAGHDGTDPEGGFMVRIAEPLRFDFPLEEDGVATTAHARLELPWRLGGIEGVHFDYVDDAFLGLITTNTILQDFWLRDLLVEHSTADALFFNGKNCEIRDCHYRWTRWPNQGGTSYIGGTLYDSLIDGITAVGFRHAPNLHGGVNVVVRNGWFDLSDAQMHAGNGIDLLYENIRTRADGQGSYGNGLTLREWDESQGGGAADRLVVFASDLHGTDFGVDFGGRNEAMVFAYNRIRAETRALFQLQDGSFDHIILGNHLIGDNRFAPVFQMGADNTPDSGLHNTGVHVVGNRIYGSAQTLTGPAPGVSETSAIARHYDNIFLPVRGDVPMPPVPSAFIDGSLYATQRAHPDGLPASGATLYHPTDDGDPDQGRAEGALVVQVNFGTDSGSYPDGWLLEDGGAFADRGTHSYGWDNADGVSARHDGYGAEGALYLGSSDFGPDDSRQWSIALPPGRYDCFLALGRPRDQERSDYHLIYPLDTDDVTVWNHSIAANDRIWEDRDWLGPIHDLAVWQSGMSDAGDKMDAAWISDVVVGNDGRLTLAATGATAGLGIQFLQIYQHVGGQVQRKLRIQLPQDAVDQGTEPRLQAQPSLLPNIVPPGTIFVFPELEADMDHQVIFVTPGVGNG